MNHNHWLKLWQSKDNGLIQIELIECNRRKKDVIWTMNCTQIKNSSLEPQNGKLAIKHFQVENKKWKIKNDYSKCHYYFHLKISIATKKSDSYFGHKIFRVWEFFFGVLSFRLWNIGLLSQQRRRRGDQHLASPGIKVRVMIRLRLGYGGSIVVI